MQEQNSHNGLILWERWVLATAAGQVVGLTAIAAINATLTKTDNLNMYAILLSIGAVEGAVIGFFQWLVLRRYIDKAIWWIVATTGGAILAWLMGLAVSILMALAFAYGGDGQHYLELMLGVIFLGFGVGAILGFAQWLILRTSLRAYIRQASWWTATNALAWGLGLLVAFMGTGIETTSKFSAQTMLISAATGAAMGTVIGGITGIALVWLLKPRWRQRQPPQGGI